MMTNPTRALAPHLVLVALLVGLVACTDDEGGPQTLPADDDAPPTGGESVESAPAEATTVVIRDNAFEPLELTVSVGETVSWVNEDEHGHTVTHGEDGGPAPGALFDEPASTGQAVTFTFEQPGTYPVTCKVHHDMQMTVIVEEAPSS